MVRPCRPLVLQLAALVLLLSAANESTHASVSLVIENARVFTGNGFEDRTLYVEDGRFTDRRPANAPDVLDLGGKFVIPPFGDAHTHRFAGSGDAASARTLSLERGFLYVANLCNPKNARAATASVTNRADGVDVIFANGAITAPEGHPVALYRSIHERRGGTDTTFVTTWRDNTFYLVDTEEELGTVWAELHATRPDLVKIILSYCENKQRSTDGVTRFGDGLDPALVAPIVRRARTAGLRVAAHVTTAEDFRRAVRGSVDWIVHTPGFGARSSEDPKSVRLSASDARAAAAAGIVLTTTAGAYERSLTAGTVAHGAVRRNLELLRDAGVTIAFGSDDWAGPDTELRALDAFGVFSKTELLRMLCETTPRVIFPDRSIGRLARGYEASFVALDSNPLESLDAWDDIAMVVKQGAVLVDRRD